MVWTKAEAMAEAARRKAKGEADGLESINKALEKAANNPQLLQLRALEVERARIDKWQGAYPTVVSGDHANTWVGIGNSPVTK
jgi:regulator of protease activity HflC (stomatin/prohibitin superfamily)